MPSSKLGVATRAFVAVLLALGRTYNLVFSVNRDSKNADFSWGDNPKIPLSRDESFISRDVLHVPPTSPP